MIAIGLRDRIAEGPDAHHFGGGGLAVNRPVGGAGWRIHGPYIPTS
jgi:hypothetical protein